MGALGIGSSRPVDFSAFADFLEAIAGGVALALKRSLLHQHALDELAERRRVQKRLQAREDQYKDLYENAPYAYFSVGSDDLIIACNQRAVHLTGRSIEDLVGSPFVQLYADPRYGLAVGKTILARFMAGETIAEA